MISISTPAVIYEDLMIHFAAEDVEHAAFLFTEPAGAAQLRVAELYRVPPEDFAFQSSYHIELSDAVRAHVIKRAWDIGGSLIEAHSHLGGPAAFSKSDLHGFLDWVPHVRWRLANRPYIALVFAGDTFDALVWQDAESPTPLESLDVDGRPSQAPTSITYSKIGRSRR
jgi:hypothetical protein